MSNSPAEDTTIRHLLRRHIEYPYGEQKATLRIILIAIFPLIKSHWSPKGQWLWPIQWIPNINLSNRFIPPQINCTSISILPFNSDRAFSSNYKIKYLRRCVCLCALRMNEIKVMKKKTNKHTHESCCCCCCSEMVCALHRTRSNPMPGAMDTIYKLQVKEILYSYTHAAAERRCGYNIPTIF